MSVPSAPREICSSFSRPLGQSQYRSVAVRADRALTFTAEGLYVADLDAPDPVFLGWCRSDYFPDAVSGRTATMRLTRDSSSSI